MKEWNNEKWKTKPSFWLAQNQTALNNGKMENRNLEFKNEKIKKYKDEMKNCHSGSEPVPTCSGSGIGQFSKSLSLRSAKSGEAISIFDFKNNVKLINSILSFRGVYDEKSFFENFINKNEKGFWENRNDKRISKMKKDSGQAGMTDKIFPRPVGERIKGGGEFHFIKNEFIKMKKNSQISFRGVYDGKSLLQNFKFAFAIFLFALISFSNLNAQSLDSLINEAMQNNTQLKALQKRIEASEHAANSAGALPPPTLGIEFSQIPVDKFNVVNDALSNSISVSQMFMLGGKLGAMSNVERKNALVGKDELQFYKNNLIAEIKMSYYKLWLIEKRISLQNETIKLLDDLLNSTLMLYQVNRVNQADALTIKSEIASNKTQLLTMQREKESEIYKLNSLIGKEDLSREIKVDDEIIENEIHIDTVNIDQNEYEKILVENNPSLKRMNSMIEMNEAMISATNKEKIPDLMIQGMLMRMPKGMLLTSQSDLSMLGMNDMGTDYMYSIMASITLPFAPWSKNKYEAKQEELAAGIRSIEYETENMRKQMIAELNNSINQLNTAKDLISLYSKDVIPLYKSAAEAQTSAYQNGKTSINTVIDSYRMLIMQEMNFIMAKADFKMAVAEIEMMLGTEIKNGDFKNE